MMRVGVSVVVVLEGCLVVVEFAFFLLVEVFEGCEEVNDGMRRKMKMTSRWKSIFCFSVHTALITVLLLMVTGQCTRCKFSIGSAAAAAAAAAASASATD